jgi:hypothetical protein
MRVIQYHIEVNLCVMLFYKWVVPVAHPMAFCEPSPKIGKLTSCTMSSSVTHFRPPHLQHAHPGFSPNPDGSARVR